MIHVVRWAAIAVGIAYLRWAFTPEVRFHRSADKSKRWFAWPER